MHEPARSRPRWLAHGWAAALAFSWVACAETASAQVQPTTAHSGRLFDPADAERHAGIGAAILWARRSDEGTYRSALEFRWVEELEWVRSVFGIHGQQGSSLRILDDGYALSIAQSGGQAGLRFGPLELMAGSSLSVLNGEWVEGRLGFGMFWPRSSASARVQLGPVRVNLGAHVEYLWSWLSRDHFVRGVGLVVSFEQPRIQPSFETH